MAKKRKVRISPLNTVMLVAAEMGRIYRLARRDEMEIEKASRFVNMLGVLRQCLESSELERRLAELEAAAPDNVLPFRRSA